MKGGLTGEDKENVSWKKDDVAPVFGVDQATFNNNTAKAKEAAESEEPTVQKISTRQVVCLTGVILVFLLSVTGTVLMWGTDIIERAIDERLVLKNGSDSFKKWSSPPVDSILKFWLFNYTNVEAFIEGKDPKLKVEEVGPFVFREVLHRVNIVYNENGTVTYQLNKKYEFLPQRSGASLNDSIVSINIPLMTLHKKALELSIFQRFGASAALNMVGAQPFITKTAYEWFHGYKDTLITLAEFKVPDVKVGILQEKNGTSPDRITIYTGETDVNMMGQISHYNGVELVDFYGGDECNKVQGADGSKFAPSTLYPGSLIYVYERDACRRIPLIGNKSVTAWDGMPALRFFPSDNIFSYGDDNPENECYCADTCLADGLFDISHCKREAPLLVSFPHFYKADPQLLETVEGLNPDPEKHQLYLDIHQRVGAPLDVRIRIQLNVLMTNGLMQSTAGKVDGYVLPYVWMERELDEYPEDIKAIIRMITYTVPAIQNALSYIFPVLVAITGTILLICAYIEIAALIRKDPPSRVASESVITRL